MYSVCSKLFLSGEYAITHPNGEAIILCIPKYTTASIVKSDKFHIYSSLFDYHIDLSKDDIHYQLIIDCIRFIFQYLDEQNIDIQRFSLTIHSELYHGDQKYGLGSSGAIVILLIKTILCFHQITFSKLELFKLAAIFLKKRNDNGSFGDIACIAFNENVYYHNFDKTFILETDNISALMKNDFNSLIIKPFQFSFPCDMLVVWSKQVAISKELVNNIHVTQPFIKESNALISAYLNCDQETFKNLIQNNRLLLQNLSSKIEIQALKQICDEAEKNGLIAKSSGAGGGDCAIVFAFNAQAKQNFKNETTYPIILEVTYE